jgi:hypothetical protein
VINEELENSLRTEVDNYFKSAFADLRQEIEQLHDSLSAEIERHRSEFEEQFKQLLGRNIQDVRVDDTFSTLVADHLKIAREEGENAAVEAFQTQLQEKEQQLTDLQEQHEQQLAQLREEHERQREEQQQQFVHLEAPPTNASAAPADYTLLRDALKDISSQFSQSEILKALVRHAGNFAPRGALFIVKSEHLIGWRVFGEEAGTGEERVREVFLPLTNDSVLSAAINNQRIEQTGVGGETHAEDEQILEKLNFEKPETAVAIPLIVRNRGVAAIYADAGASGAPVQTEALETLMRVASLTVELLAASKAPVAAASQQRQTVTPSEQGSQRLSSFTERATQQPSYVTDRVGSSSASGYVETPRNGNHGYHPTGVETAERTVEETTTAVATADYEAFSFSGAKPAEAFEDSVTAAPQTAGDYATETVTTTETDSAPPPQPTAQTAAARRFGERNVELPIDVPEEERRYHNDARRFARLLVSEIKLYNEQKVREGRASGDLYDRLREAVDRSREMYDKRVSPLVAGKYDYFHFELINTLAEGDASKLGTDYPGATA